MKKRIKTGVMVLFRKVTVGVLLPIVMLFFSLSVAAEQRLEMEGTAIVGNKELPKILYIVPWKSTETISLSTPSFNSVMDEEFQPVERSAFKREREIYNDLYNKTNKTP